MVCIVSGDAWCGTDAAWLSNESDLMMSVHLHIWERCVVTDETYREGLSNGNESTIRQQDVSHDRRHYVRRASLPMIQYSMLFLVHFNLFSTNFHNDHNPHISHHMITIYEFPQEPLVHDRCKVII